LRFRLYIFLIIISCWTPLSASNPDIVERQKYQNELSHAQLFPIQRKGRLSYIDATGKVQLKTDFRIKLTLEKVLQSKYTYSEGLALIPKIDLLHHYLIGKRILAINSKGKMIYQSEYPWVGKYSEGLAQVRDIERIMLIKSNIQYGFIDTAGVLKIPPQFDFAGPFRDGRAEIKKNGKYGFIDQDGQVVIPAKFAEAYPFSAGLASVRETAQFGYISPQGDYVIEPQFDRAWPFVNGLARVMQAGKVGFIDQQGNYAIPPRFDSAFNFREGVALISFQGKIGYIDRQGNHVIEPEYQAGGSFHNGLAPVLIDGKYGFINQQNELIIANKYDFASPFNKGLAIVTLGKRIFYLDIQGIEVAAIRD